MVLGLGSYFSASVVRYLDVRSRVVQHEIPHHKPSSVGKLYILDIKILKD